MQLITSYKRYGRPTACQSACQCCSSTLSVSPQKIIWSVKLNSQLDRFGKIRGNFIKKRPVKTKIRSSRYSLVTRSSGNRNTLYAELVHIISHVCPIAIAQHGSDYKITPVISGCVCLCVCPRYHGRNFYPILTKLSTDVWNLKRKNHFTGVKIQ